MFGQNCLHDKTGRYLITIIINYNRLLKCRYNIFLKRRITYKNLYQMFELFKADSSGVINQKLVLT